MFSVICVIHKRHQIGEMAIYKNHLVTGVVVDGIALVFVKIIYLVHIYIIGLCKWIIFVWI